MLLDEPSLGLAPILVEEIFRIIREIHASGTTVLLVEQNANKALSIADYGYVLETGTIALAGRQSALLRNDHVRRSYLGQVKPEGGDVMKRLSQLTGVVWSPDRPSSVIVVAKRGSTRPGRRMG